MTLLLAIFRAANGEVCLAVRGYEPVARSAPVRWAAGVACDPRPGFESFRPAQHHGWFGRVQIGPHDVQYILDKQRIARQLKRLGAMGLQGKRSPNVAGQSGVRPKG